MNKKIPTLTTKTIIASKSVYTKALEYKKVSIVLAIVLLAGGYYYYTSKSSVSSITYQYATVRRGSISSTVSATGQVAPTSQVDLKPKVNANVTGVYVKAGDRVHTGQVLFRLDATDAYKQVRDAKTSLESAQLSLEKLRNPKSIDVMNATNAIKQEEDTKSTNNQKVDTAYNTLLNAGLAPIPEISYTSETAPSLTGNYTKSTEGQIKITVYQGGTSGYSFSYSGVVNGTGNVNTSVAQPIGDSGLYIKWNNNNPQTNWLINIPNKQSTSYLSNYTAWQNAVTNRDIANAASDRNIISLKQKLADLTPDDSNLDVKSALLSVSQRENSLLDAQQTLTNYTLIAPFDGVMASVSGDIGVSAVMASSNGSTALGTIVTDKKMAQITLNESDVVKVRLGQKANVTFDAIDGLIVEGSVVEINTLGTVTQGVVTYKVRVAFNADDVRILPNMSVSVDILTDSKDGVLYLPNQAIKHDVTGYYVEEDTTEPTFASSSRRFGGATSTDEMGMGSSSRRMMFASSTASLTFARDGMGSSTRTRGMRGGFASSTSMSVPTTTTFTRVPVTIGTQNDTQTEILTGVTLGERVITNKKTVATATTKAPSVTSLLRPQGQAGTRPAGATGGTAPRGQ
jgi:HlyD family secretion protein